MREGADGEREGGKGSGSQQLNLKEVARRDMVASCRASDDRPLAYPLRGPILDLAFL